MESLGSSNAYRPFNEFEVEVSKEMESSEQSLVESSNQPDRKDSDRRDSQEIPHSITKLPNVPPQRRPSEEVGFRKGENAALDHEDQLMQAVKTMSKGTNRASIIPKPLRNPIDSGGKVASKAWKAKGEIIESVPFGVGYAAETISEHKKANTCRKEAKAIEKELKGEPLSRKEVRIIKSEIKLKKADIKNLKAEIKHIDREMAKDYKERDKAPLDSNKMQTQMHDREALQIAVGDLSQHVKTLRCKLFTADMSQTDKEQKIDELDQKVKQQDQHNRKGFGHGSRAVGGASYSVFTVGKVGSLAGDIALASTALTPITAGIGLAAGTAGVALKTRNIAKGANSLNVLKGIKKDARACKARALYQQSIASDPTQDSRTQQVSNAKAQLELQNARLAKDYVQIQKKLSNRKIVVNSIGLAENTALIAASSTSLLTLIPEPTTSATMYGLTLGLTGVKYALMLTEFGYEKGSEVMEERTEKKMLNRVDFGDNPKHEKGISKSHLGVEIRLAQMIKNGVALPSIVKYHGIIDEAGFVEHVEQTVQKLGDKQMLKKASAVIHNFADQVENDISQLMAQLPPEEQAA
ncbi:MAG: hypothetical protein Q8K75_04355 [Chlamydiales bacterium]|nr:hypothetical protein [Chlamydiales bacterium]